MTNEKTEKGDPSISWGTGSFRSLEELETTIKDSQDPNRMYTIDPIYGHISGEYSSMKDTLRKARKRYEISQDCCKEVVFEAHEGSDPQKVRFFRTNVVGLYYAEVEREGISLADEHFALLGKDLLGEEDQRLEDLAGIIKR